jgi:hypothetical protein
LFLSINSDYFPKYNDLNISDSRNSRNCSLRIQFIFLYEILIIVLNAEKRRHGVIVQVKLHSVLTSVLDGYISHLGKIAPRTHWLGSRARLSLVGKEKCHYQESIPVPQSIIKSFQIYSHLICGSAQLYIIVAVVMDTRFLTASLHWQAVSYGTWSVSQCFSISHTGTENSVILYIYFWRWVKTLKIQTWRFVASRETAAKLRYCRIFRLNVTVLILTPPVQQCFPTTCQHRSGVHYAAPLAWNS